MGDKGKTKAHWDRETDSIFLDLCVEQVYEKNLHLGVLNAPGKKMLRSKFNSYTGRDYTWAQLKNRWDTLKCNYTMWKTLLHGSTGLGRDPTTGAIIADDSWWDEKLQAMSQCGKFRSAPLPREDDMRLVFDGAACTSAPSRVPGEVEETDTFQWDDQFDLSRPSTATKRGSGEMTVDRGKNKLPRGDELLDRFVTAFELANPTAKQVADADAQDIAHLLELVREAGADEQSDEYFYASELLMIKGRRDVFRTLRTPEGRLAWLRRTFNFANNK